ncbi:craniofacial development protein 2-like [Palaemon carinicauda]|uniref:craniofacial development protein 2-like n=1 Tax=Palaemon carinicauda TaxID=392227 RepID=UPI0035B68C50
MRGKHKNFKVIQVYAPDSSYKDEDVENFYSQLEEEIEKTKTGDVVIEMGDFISKIGDDSRGYEDMMGKFGLGERNERGQKMLEFWNFARNRWKTSVMGTEVMRRADFGTSHELLLSNIRFKFRTDRGRGQELVRYNLDTLKNEEVKTAFKVRVGGHFEPLIGFETTEEK